MSRNHPVRNLVEVGFSGGFTRGSSFLATPGFVTGVCMSRWDMDPLESCGSWGGIDRRDKARAALAAAEEAA